MLAPAIPTIGRDLGRTDLIPWIISAYFVTSTVTLLYGKLADIHGRRGVLYLAIGVFLAGSIICAAAPSMLALVAGRAVQGLGGGADRFAQTVIADLVPPRERAGAMRSTFLGA
ncbi:MAG: MFS transporter [Hyphomicrobiaceae bacterium]